MAAAAAVLWEAESEEPQPANMGSAMAATRAVETIIFFIKPILHLTERLCLFRGNTENLRTGPPQNETLMKFRLRTATAVTAAAVTSGAADECAVKGRRLRGSSVL